MGGSTAGRGDWLTTCAIGLTALVPRLYVAVAWAREPVWDGHYYDFGAQRIAAGLGYSDDLLVAGQSVWHPWCHYPVGYSGFLAGLYRVFGDGWVVAPIANALLGMLIVMLTHRLALQMVTVRRARIAAGLCAASPELILYSPLVMTELLATFLPLLAGWLSLLHRDRAPLRGALVSGGIIGLATLVHPQSILLAPLVGLMLPAGVWRPHVKQALGLATAASLAALLVVTPWTLRNCRVMDGCALVSTNGGWNLAIGAFERATGRFETLRASDGCRVVTGQVQQDRCWAEVGLQAIVRDPARWLSLAPKKLGFCFDHASFAVEYLREANPAAWPEQRRVHWREIMTLAHRLLLSVAALGVVGIGARTTRALIVETSLLSAAAGLIAYAWTPNVPAFWPLAVFIVVAGLLPRRSAPHQGPVSLFAVGSIAIFVGTHVVFFGEDRYHVPLIPLLCVLAAASARRAG